MDIIKQLANLIVGCVTLAYKANVFLHLFQQHFYNKRLLSSFKYPGTLAVQGLRFLEVEGLKSLAGIS